MWLVTYESEGCNILSACFAHNQNQKKFSLVVMNVRSTDNIAAPDRHSPVGLVGILMQSTSDLGPFATVPIDVVPGWLTIPG